jgi:uncharacterized protein YdeI (YjbR/CyaY-like superfamily)
MPAFNPAVDRILSDAQPFAQPILEHLRMLVHRVCPEAEEKIKWQMPFFEYRGKNLCHIAAFKRHCVLGFWYQSVMTDPDGILKRAGEGGMGSLGKIRSMKDLPTDEQLSMLLAETMMLIEKGVKLPGPKDKPEPEIPAILSEALAGDEIATATFEAFRSSHRREYINWINEARGEDTKLRRVRKTIENLREGKKRF